MSNNEFNEALLDQLENLAHLKPSEINSIINAYNNFEFSLATEKIKALMNVIELKE